MPRKVFFDCNDVPFTYNPKESKVTIEVEMPETPSLKTMEDRKAKFFRARSRARRKTVRYMAENAFQNLIKDIGLNTVQSSRSTVLGFEGKPRDAKATRSTNEALSILLYIAHRLENDGLLAQARRILKERRKDVERNRARDRKRVISQKYLEKLAAIKG